MVLFEPLFCAYTYWKIYCKVVWMFAKEFRLFLVDLLGSQVNLLGIVTEHLPWQVAYTRCVGDSGGQEAQNHRCVDEQLIWK